jgi:hypothetical protein
LACLMACFSHMRPGTAILPYLKNSLSQRGMAPEGLIPKDAAMWESIKRAFSEVASRVNTEIYGKILDEATGNGHETPVWEVAVVGGVLDASSCSLHNLDILLDTLAGFYRLINPIDPETQFFWENLASATSKYFDFQSGPHILGHTYPTGGSVFSMMHQHEAMLTFQCFIVNQKFRFL